MMIRPEQVEYHPMSLQDPSGRLFRFECGLYRSISRELAPVYAKLFENGTIARLTASKLLIETERTDLRMEGSEMVLRHRTVPFVSYPFEWSAGMLKAAALKTLDLEIELSKQGLTLQDAHPWNVLFDGTEPWFVDFGSIVPLPAEWSSGRNWLSYEMFCRFFLRPLILMERGFDHIARWLLFDGELGVSGDDLAALTGRKDRLAAMRQTAKAIRQRGRAVAHEFVPTRLRAWVHQRLDGRRKELAETLDRMTGDPFSPKTLRRRVEEINATARESRALPLAEYREPEVRRFFDEQSPQSVLHVGAVAREYAAVSARRKIRTAAVFLKAVDAQGAYETAMEEHLDLLPVVMDFRRPWPEFGLGQCFGTPAPARLACEAVAALALPSRLAVQNRISFEETAGALSAYSRRWVLTDFVPAGDPSLPPGKVAPPWYAADNFEAALKRRFRHVRRAGSDRPGGRLLFVCEK